MVKIEDLQQSLLTTAQYKKYSQKYKTYNPIQRRSTWPQSPPPNWKMGEGFSPGEIRIINDRIEELRKLLPLIHILDKD